jgi:diacylglycerol kinase family enzyme
MFRSFLVQGMPLGATLTAMPERGFLVINPRSGDGSPSAAELAAEAKEHGLAVHVLGRDDDASQIARSADAAAIGVAGGDGSLAAVASVALERGLPFVCVPFGTRNHFARDLGLDPDDPVAALDAFDGAERRIDAGRAGDRLFLNNVSIGLYAGLVHERERHRFRRRMLATARALMLAVRRRPEPLTIDGQSVLGRIVLVANNDYQLDLFSLGRRERLDEGRLYLYLAEGLLPTRWDSRSGDRFEIGSGSGVLHAAIDGEPVELEAPVELTSEPGALRVLLTRDPG